MKKCSKCGASKPKSEFYSYQRSLVGGELKTYYASKCMPCHRGYGLDWWRNNPEKAHARWLRYRHSMTLEQYNSILISQNGKCAICKQDETERKYFSVDHNHVTGKIRGLLCDMCNTSIGKMRESPDFLRNAAEYLEKHS